MIDTLETYLKSKAKRKTGRLTLATLGALKLLEDETKFGQGRFFDFPRSGCMCTLGAVQRADLAARDCDERYAFDIVDQYGRVAVEAGAYKLNGNRLSVGKFNDTQPYAAVMKELRKVHRYAKQHGL